MFSGRSLSPSTVPYSKEFGNYMRLHHYKAVHFICCHSLPSEVWTWKVLHFRILMYSSLLTILLALYSKNDSNYFRKSDNLDLFPGSRKHMHYSMPPNTWWFVYMFRHIPVNSDNRHCCWVQIAANVWGEKAKSIRLLFLKSVIAVWYVEKMCEEITILRSSWSGSVCTHCSRKPCKCPPEWTTDA